MNLRTTSNLRCKKDFISRMKCHGGFWVIQFGTISRRKCVAQLQSGRKAEGSLMYNKNKRVESTTTTTCDPSISFFSVHANLTPNGRFSRVTFFSAAICSDIDFSTSCCSDSFLSRSSPTITAILFFIFCWTLSMLSDAPDWRPTAPTSAITD